MDIDGVAKSVQALIAMSTNRDVWIALGTVTSFDPTTYRSKVVLAPNHVTAGPLPYLVPFHGFAPDVSVGAACVVLCNAGTPVVIAGIYYTRTTPIPAGAMVVDGDLRVLGTLAADLMFAPPVHGALPLATSDWANQLVVVAAAPSVPSTLHFCVDEGDSTYSWKQVTLS